jgi:hypothetical protein
MADVMLKEAFGQPAAAPPQQQKQPGKMEKYMPWYGAAGLGAVGHHLGKMVPKKYQFAGSVAGTLAGTALGVHGGEALGRKLDQRKTAEARPGFEKYKRMVGALEESKKRGDFIHHPHEKTAAKEEKPPHPGATLGKSLLGFGLGTAGGYLGVKGVNALMKSRGGPGLPSSAALTALPVVTGLGGLAYSRMQGKTLKKMRGDHLSRQEKKSERKGS